MWLVSDLSKNRLSDVPSEVCHLVALESLNLYHNCIRSIPDAVISLHSLTSLNLRYARRLVWWAMAVGPHLDACVRLRQRRAKKRQ